MRYELSDYEWTTIKPMLPNKPRGVRRISDRRVLNGIFWVLRSSAPWCDLPENYGPYTACYNRFVRWAERGVWERLFRELAARGRSTEMQMIDATYIKAHRSASGAKRGNTSRRLVARAAAEIRKSTQSQMIRAVFFPSC